METLKIFVSGTDEGMQPERDAISRAADSVETAEDIRVELTVSKGQSPSVSTREQIEACDLYLGVFGHRYGVVSGEDVSPAELEFNWAEELRRPVLVWIRELRDEEEKLPHFQRQERFLERLKASGPRMYSAISSLSGKGLISSAPYDRSRQKKRMLNLTSAGRKFLET